MNERKMNLGKIAMVGGMIAMTAMLSAIMMTGCGCQQRTEKTVSTADSAATADSAPKPTYSEEEQAVLDENLSIDASGNVVDCSGKQLKVDDDGKVEVKKSDGTVIKVDADTVRKTIEKAENRRQRQLCCSDAVAAICFTSTADVCRTKDKSRGSADNGEADHT